MSEESDECEFWLPPQFLTDCDHDGNLSGELTERNNLRRNNRTLRKDCEFEISQEFCFCFPNSDQSSPVYGSAEAESEDEEYVPELFRQNYSNIALLRPGLIQQSTKREQLLSISPKSTLHSAFGGFEYNHRGSHDSLDNYSKLFPSQGINRNGKAWDAMDAAAEDVARRRLVENELEYLKQREIMKGRQSCIEGGRVHDFRRQETLHGGWRNGGAERQSPAPPQYREMQHGLNMRALFPTNFGSKNERAGTGVFLPRRSGPSAETRGNPACSSPLLPAQVVEALNLKVQAMDASENTPKSHVLPVGCTNAILEHKIEAQSAPEQNCGVPAQSIRNQEVWLPEEWTY